MEATKNKTKISLTSESIKKIKEALVFVNDRETWETLMAAIQEAN